ncbi:MAG: pseudouridine synthase [Gallicola sp.]|nr:pseudouridine synthase [Gallicola sp.]
MTENNEGTRINQYLSRAGICSRRQADALIAEGRVRVNGQIAELGTKVSPTDVVFLEDRNVSAEKAPEALYIALNKPRGVVCTTDLREPDNIVDYLNFEERIFPIGRLDKDSSGLILLTNDGSIVNRILRAQFGHEKEYVVRVDQKITPEFLKKMRGGVPILDTMTKPCKVQQISEDEFRIILTQGLNRQIRRMCEYLNYRVLRLKRIRVMHITLGRMQIGEWRKLSYKELNELENLLQKAEAKSREYEF